MKNLILIAAFALNGLLLKAQECTDIVYPSQGEEVIFDCCIDEVKYGNIVRYTKDNESHVVAALSIVKGGVTLNLKPYSSIIDNTGSNVANDSLYRGHDYAYYNDLHLKARSQRAAGVLLTVFGFLSTVGGAVALSQGNENGAYFYVGGAILVNIGVPVWISGAVKTGNNRKAMEEAKRKKSLSFIPVNQGLGLAFKF